MAQDTQDNPTDDDARRPLAGFAKGTFEVRDDFGDDVELVATPRQAGALDALCRKAERGLDDEVYKAADKYCEGPSLEQWSDFANGFIEGRRAALAALTADTGAKP